MVKKAIGLLHQDVGTLPLWNNVTVYSMRSNMDYAPQQHRLPALALKYVTVKAD
jgi:hypothetical protein